MHGLVSRTAPVPAALCAALLLCAAPAAAAKPASSLPAAVAEKVDRVFGDWVAPGEPGAVVLVTRQGKPVFRNSYGMASVELDVPASAPDLVYQIGSLTKQTTAIAALMLVDEGKLRLDSTIGALLPGFAPAAQGITLEQLLGHTSGLVNYINLPEWASIWGKEVTSEQLLDYFRRRPLAAQPGAEFEYNNSGYVAAGRMIEVASGQSYADFVRTRILEPLGMAHSGYNDFNAVLKGRVPGYTRTGDGWQNSRAVLHPSQLFSAGALYSTVDDLSRLQNALAGGKLLSPALLQRMTSPGRLNEGLATGYGLGWAVSTQQGRKVLEHGGATNGFYCAVVWLPEDGVWGAVTTNRYGFADKARELLAVAVKRVAGWPEREAPVALDAAALDELQGWYRLLRGPEWIEVTRDGDHLVTRKRDGEPQPAYPRGPREFFRADRPELLRFEVDAATGTRSLVTVVPYIGERRFVRSAAAPSALEAGSGPAAAPPLDPAVYVGRYSLGADLEIEVVAVDSGLAVNAMGYQKVPLTATGEHEFALALAFGTVRFQVENGRAVSLVFTQGGQEMKGTRIPD